MQNIMKVHNSKYHCIWQHTAYTTDQLLPVAKQEPYKQAYLLRTNSEEFSGGKVKRMGQRAEKI